MGGITRFVMSCYCIVLDIRQGRYAMLEGLGTVRGTHMGEGEGGEGVKGPWVMIWNSHTM